MPDERATEVRSLLAEAAEIVAGLPDDLRLSAFDKAVQMLSGGAEQANQSRSSRQRRRSGGPKKAGGEVDDGGDVVDRLIQGIDRTAHPEVGKEERVLERSLHVLRIARDEFEIDGLTAPQIAKVLTGKFRLRTSRQAVAGAFKTNSNLVDDAPKGRNRIYRLMASGEEYLRGHGE